MTQRPVTEAARHRPRSLILPGVLVVVISWLIALLVTAPISLVPTARLALPPGVQLTPLSGTLWHGQWRLTLPRAPAVIINTDFLPMSILRLQPGWHVQAKPLTQDGQARSVMKVTADVAFSLRHVSVRIIQGHLAADDPLISALVPWSLGGMIDFNGTISLTRNQGDLALQTASIMANWLNARITTTEPLQLGHLVFRAEIAHGQTHITAQPAAGDRGPLSGQLEISGTWPLTSAPTVRGHVKPTSLASEALRQQLNLLGVPDARGDITIHGLMPGRY